MHIYIYIAHFESSATKALFIPRSTLQSLHMNAKIYIQMHVTDYQHACMHTRMIILAARIFSSFNSDDQ